MNGGDPKELLLIQKKAKSSYAYNNQRGIYKNRFKSIITYTKTHSKKINGSRY